MTPLAVQFQKVGKVYPDFQLHDLDLELPEGQVMGFIGPNGAGKSTTLRILMGLVHPERGNVRVLGRRMPAEQIEAKWDVGYFSDDMRLYGQSTVGWHCAFMASIFPSWDTDLAEQLLRRFDLKHEQKIRGLSHGQRVKAGILLVLARRPKLLVLDEPTTGLDPVARHEVLGELMEVLAEEERSILFSSHNTLDVEQISDHITFIDRGRILDSRDKESFLDRWRRLRVELAEGAEMAPLPGEVGRHRNGRSLVVTVRHFTPELPLRIEEAGGQIRATEPLTLEEIFVAHVEASRQEVAS